MRIPRGLDLVAACLEIAAASMEECKPCLGQGHLLRRVNERAKSFPGGVRPGGRGGQVAGGQQGMEGRRRCPGQGRSHQTFQTNSCPQPLLYPHTSSFAFLMFTALVFQLFPIFQVNVYLRTPNTFLKPFVNTLPVFFLVLQ